MKKTKIAVIGLGYVGLPVSIIFSKKYKVIGYDINRERINKLNNSIDDTMEVSYKKLKKALNTNLSVTNNINRIKDCNFYIITVPTPVNINKSPNISSLIDATKSIGRLLSKGDIVIYESTVYPGCTEQECVPVLEKESGLKFNKDFFCGYSPERINPGDKKHTIDKIVKVVSGSTKDATTKINKVYSSVIKAGTYIAGSIKVAEAAKVIENSQRDINIAFVNELAKIFNTMNIDTNDVLEAASTKWNFINFRPGLVGGHCIGVDPYYLAYKAKKQGYNPEIILSGRKVNDSMGKFVVDQVFNKLKENKLSSNLKVLILGATFKENCPDYRNTKVIDMYIEFKKLNAEVDIYDPWIDKDSFYDNYQIIINNQLKNKKYHAIILAVAHNEFKKIDIKDLKLSDDSVIYDVKGFLDRKQITQRL